MKRKGVMHMEKKTGNADSRINNLLIRVVKRFQFYNEKVKSDNPVIASAAEKMREVTMWEMWALTQIV